jgi:TonB family protein
MDPVDFEYFHWYPEGAPFSIHMQLDAIDGIARDVIEGVKILPRHGLEVGGLLLGRIDAGERPAVWIERFQRIECQHRFGPHFILDDQDRAEMETAAARILENRDVAIVGLYRTHIRPDVQLEPPDLDLIDRYFSDPTDLVLLIKTDDASDLSGQFYGRDSQPIGGTFRFRGHRLGGSVESDVDQDTDRDTDRDQAPGPVETLDTVSGADAAIVEREPEARAEEEPEEPDTQRHWIERPEAEAAAGERARRLVPDFVAPPADPPRRLEPLRSEAPLMEPAPAYARYLEPESPPLGERLKRWGPLVAALLLVGGILWFVLRPASHESATAPPQAIAETGRPLGLSVEPMGTMWQLSWNPNATALQDPRRVQLFVREGEDQKLIDLTQPNLTSGTYQYRPAGNDVTFRLEVTDRTGRVSAESFRLSRTAAAAAAPPPPSALAKAPAGPDTSEARFTPPKAIHKAPPVVAAGIRPRIKGMVPIDVRVQVDTHGRVTSASPITKQRSGLEAYLATCAVKAARLWRFEPARDGDQAVPGTQTIHFVFEK